MNRLAIYFLPDPQSELGRIAADWLGRTIYSGQRVASKRRGILTDKRYQEITRSPYHYGFHATIKPPFQLAVGVDTDLLISRLKEFAANQTPFVIPNLQLGIIDDFFCLRPVGPCSMLSEMAMDVVRIFDHFRKPASAGEITRRRAAGLTPRQDELLMQYGYPYVMEEYRFHLTLTGSVQDENEKRVIQQELATLFVPEVLENIPFNSLSLSIERDGAPFENLHWAHFSEMLSFGQPLS